MTPGPDQIVACPHCKALAMDGTLNSGNTFGATVWTDGKQIAPMLPLPPAVVKCHECGECYWLDDAEEIGSIEPWDSEEEEVDPAWAAAPAVQEPTEDEYYQALGKGLATDPDQERTARIMAWWRRNDAFRDASDTHPRPIATAAGAWRENLVALANLLDETDEDDRVMKAEVLRELGELEAAKRTLGQITSKEYAQVVRQIRALCDNQDTAVSELKFPD